jgi:hypothetical protein
VGQTIYFGFTNSNYEYTFIISNKANVYSFAITFGPLNFMNSQDSAITSTTIQNLYIGLDNGIFSCWNNGTEILDLNSTNNANKYDFSSQLWQQYILGSGGTIISIPTLFPFSKFGTLLGSVNSSNYPTSIADYGINTSITLTTNVDFPLGTITNNNMQINLVCVDSSGNNILTTDTPLFTWNGTNISFATSVIQLNYTSDYQYPKTSDLIYTSTIKPKPSSGTYTYHLYLGMVNASAYTSSMTATLNTFEILNDINITDQNIIPYLTQSDKLAINQNYTTAYFTIPSSSFLSLVNIAFPNPNSYYKLTIPTFTISGNIDRMGVGAQEVFNITLYLSEMDNTNQPIKSGICNSYGISFNLAPEVLNWNYSLPLSNTIELWYYNKTPTSQVVLSAFCSTHAISGTCGILNMSLNGLLTSSPMIDTTSSITIPTS